MLVNSSLPCTIIMDNIDYVNNIIHAIILFPSVNGQFMLRLMAIFLKHDVIVWVGLAGSFKYFQDGVYRSS